MPKKSLEWPKILRILKESKTPLSKKEIMKKYEFLRYKNRSNRRIKEVIKKNVSNVLNAGLKAGILREIKNGKEIKYHFWFYEPLEPKIRKSVTAFRKKHLRDPTIEEIAEDIEESIEKVRKVMNVVGPKLKWKEPTEEDIFFDKIIINLVEEANIVKGVIVKKEWKQEFMCILAEKYYFDLNLFGKLNAKHKDVEELIMWIEDRINLLEKWKSIEDRKANKTLSRIQKVLEIFMKMLKEDVEKKKIESIE